MLETDQSNFCSSVSTDGILEIYNNILISVAYSAKHNLITPKAETKIFFFFLKSKKIINAGLNSQAPRQGTTGMWIAVL